MSYTPPSPPRFLRYKAGKSFAFTEGPEQTGRFDVTNSAHAWPVPVALVAKCSYCGQYGDYHTECKKCGAPIE